MHKTEAFSPIRSLKSAIDLLMKAPLPLWVGGLIMVVVESIGSFAGSGTDIHIKGSEDIDHVLLLLIPMMLIGFALSIAVMAATAWLKIGYFRSVETVMRTGTAEFEDIFRLRPNWLKMFLTILFQALLSVGIIVPMVLVIFLVAAVVDGLDMDEGVGVGSVLIAMLAYIPVAAYFFLGIVLMPFPAALDNRGPMESLSDSWNLAKGVRINLFLMTLLQIALVLVGMLACCVGVIPASIVGYVMFCEAYIQATRTDTEGWWVRSKTPPGGEDPEASEWGSAESPQDKARPVEVQEMPAVAVAFEPEPEPEPEGPDEEEALKDDSMAAPEPAPEEVADDGQEPSADGKGEEGGFDPAAWRKGSDIPPIEP